MDTPEPLTPEEVLGVARVPPAISAQQAGALLGVSKQTIYRAFEAGEVQGTKIRGRLVIASRPLLELLGWGDPPDRNAPR